MAPRREPHSALVAYAGARSDRIVEARKHTSSRARLGRLDLGPTASEAKAPRSAAVLWRTATSMHGETTVKRSNQVDHSVRAEVNITDFQVSHQEPIRRG